MALVMLPRRPAAVKAPLGARLQTIAHLDPEWMKQLEILVDWKLAQLGVKKAS